MSHKGIEWKLCLSYLPKPRKRHLRIVVSCADCNKLFVGTMGYDTVHWEPLKEEE